MGAWKFFVREMEVRLVATEASRTAQTTRNAQLQFQAFWARRNHVYAPPLTMALSEPAGAILAYGAYRLHMTPNMVTAMAFVMGTAASVLYYVLPLSYVSGVVLLLMFQLSYALDCADGQLARCTKRTSELGYWFDAAMDFGHMLSIPAAMTAWALVRMRSPHAWMYVIAGFTLAYARVLALFGSSLRRHSGSMMKPTTSIRRRIYRLTTDTATLLAITVLVRLHAGALLLVMSGYAVIFLVHAVYLGKRFGAAEHARQEQ